MKHFFSRKLLGLILTIIGNFLIAKNVPAEVVGQVLATLNVVAGVYIFGQSAEDVVEEYKKPDVIEQEITAEKNGVALKDKSVL